MPKNTQSVAAILKRTLRVPSDEAKDATPPSGRVEEGERESARRLKSIFTNNLAPARNITNYTNAFKEHALAIGVVGGVHQTLTDAKNSISNHGPRLNGLAYSSALGRFHTPHSLLTYVNDSQFGTGSGKTLVIQTKSIPNAPYALKLFSADRDLKPFGGAASAANPATRVLAFDFDQKQHPEKLIKDEVLSLVQILHKAGLYNWIVDSSTTGYHVLVMLNRPVRLRDTAEFFKGIEDAFVTLDTQPMAFAGGAISVPFSLGKAKNTRRLLVHKRSEDFVYQRKVNKTSDWYDISDALINGIRQYDRVHLRAMSYDQGAVRLAERSMELWNASVSIKHGSKTRTDSDHLLFEANHLALMATKSYNSASEERFSIAGAMMTIYGFSDEALEDSVKRLISSTDPMPEKYRELIRNSTGKVSVQRAARKDLISAREKSNRVRGWVGLINGSSFTKVAVSDDIEFTPEARGLIRLLLDEKDKEKALTYTQLAILRSYIQFANARHHEHLNAVERGLDEIPPNPFTDPVPFALSMVTRLTGLPHGTAYDHTMSCSAGLRGNEDYIESCRAQGQENGLFCKCHAQWGPYFSVSHLGHAGEADENNRASECRDHSFCTSEGCESKARTSTFVQFKTNPNNEINDEHEASWMYKYLSSRDPIFNESALGSAGFHMYTVISESKDRLFLGDLETVKLQGAGVAGAISSLMEAGLIGRHSRRGKYAFLTHNPVEAGSLAYRLRHERRLHANDQRVGFRSAMMGTGDITQFVLSFASDTDRLHSLAQDVLNYEAMSNEHAPAQLRDPEGGVVTSVADFCRAHGLPMPPRKIPFMRSSMIDGECDLSQKTEHPFRYLIEEAEERTAPEQLLDKVHHRDDFISAAEQLEAFEGYVFGTEFTPSKLLSEMFQSRHDSFLFTQQCIAEREQHESD